MLDRLLEFYTKRVSSHGLVFRHLRCIYYAVPTFMVVGLGSALISSFGLILPNWSYYAIVVPFLLSFAMMLLLNQRAKAIVSKKYGIASTGFLWRSAEFEDYQVSLLMQYLVSKGLQSEHKVKLLIHSVGEEAKRSKISPYIAPGVLLALFLPAWSVVVGDLYHRAGGIENSVSIMIVVTVATYLIAYLLVGMKSTFGDLRDTLFPSRATRLARLLSLLEECQLRMPDQITPGKVRCRFARQRRQ